MFPQIYARCTNGLDVHCRKFTYAHLVRSAKNRVCSALRNTLPNREPDSLAHSLNKTEFFLALAPCVWSLQETETKMIVLVQLPTRHEQAEKTGLVLVVDHFRMKTTNRQVSALVVSTLLKDHCISSLHECFMNTCADIYGEYHWRYVNLEL
jgi:hypothetical protein